MIIAHVVNPSNKFHAFYCGDLVDDRHFEFDQNFFNCVIFVIIHVSFLERLVHMDPVEFHLLSRVECQESDLR